MQRKLNATQAQCNASSMQRCLRQHQAISGNIRQYQAISGNIMHNENLDIYANPTIHSFGYAQEQTQQINNPRIQQLYNSTIN
jgi:hypothetical protein